MSPELPEMTPAEKFAAGVLLIDTDVAALIGASLQTVRNWRYLGVGPRFVRLGRRMVRYQPADLQAFIDGHEDAR